jgi:hypothetical protein
MAKRNEAYDRCHVYRHWWEPTTVDTEGDYYVQHMQCARCTMVRRWKVSRLTGDPVGNSYTAPQGYYRSTDDDTDPHQARNDLRLFEIERNKKRRK